jgi:hypothetical protein
MGSPAHGYPLTASRMAQQIAEQTGKEPTTDWLWKRQFDELERHRRMAEKEYRLQLLGMLVGCVGLLALVVKLFMEEM